MFFLGSDSLIAYKTTFCYCIGVYLMTILKLVYAEPRPYWTHSEINTPANECDLSYGNPSLSTFNLVFFWSYTAYMKLYRYVKVEERRSYQIWLAAFMIAIAELILIQTFWIFGITFLYQQLISLLYTIIFITGCVNFDKEIMSYCEKSGFLLRSSRRNKFYIFFACVLLFVIITTTAEALGDAWTINIKWVNNAFDVSVLSPLFFANFCFIRYKLIYC